MKSFFSPIFGVSRFGLLPSPVADSSLLLSVPLFSVVNENDNDLLDLKDITIDINILSSTPKKETKKADKADKCSGDAGCCVKIVDGGHNVKNTNDNDLVDAKGLNLSLNLLNGNGNGGGLLSGLLGGLGL